MCDVMFREQEILYHDDDLESFYSSFVALATHYICVGIGTCMYSISCICYCRANIPFVMCRTVVKTVNFSIIPVYRPVQWREGTLVRAFYHDSRDCASDNELWHCSISTFGKLLIHLCLVPVHN